MGTVAKTKLKRMDRFELLELIYNMRKANLELTERLEAAEKKIEELKTEADQRVEAVRAEYVQRIDELRMQGSAKEMQKRLLEIEERMMAFQRIMGKDEADESQEKTAIEEDEQAECFPLPDFDAPQPAPAAIPVDPQAEEADFPLESGGEPGESRE